MKPQKIAAKPLIVLGIAILSCVGLKAQSFQGNQSVTYFYIVNFDENLVNAINSPDTVNNVSNVQEMSDNSRFIAGIVDTFYYIASEKFKNELGLDLLPLNELQGKVKYSNTYPECPYLANVKKAIKTASGYKYYVDYFVNIFSDLSPESSLEPSAHRIRPLYALSFTIYDREGRQIKEIKLSYKSRKSLGDNKENLASPSQIMKSKLCTFYNEALNELTEVYKTNNPIQI